jgi:hypothetical protein
MNIITQFYKTSKEDIDKTLNFLKNHNTYIFTDTRVNVDNLKTFRRDTRLKWVDIFQFIYDNKKFNEEGTYILQPGYTCNFELNIDGISIFNGGVYVKNIKNIPQIRRYIFEDYEFLRLNIEGTNLKVASICHIYYEDLLEEVIEKQRNLLTTKFDTDYYFSLTQNNSTDGQKVWVKEKLKKEFPNCKIFELPNKGLDIGPFFKILETILREGKGYDYILKTHTKKSLKTSGEFFGNIWRKDLWSIMDNIENIVELMIDKELMVGSNKWIINLNKDNLNVEYLNNLKNEFNISNGDQFIGGTMFWVRYDLLTKYFNINNLSKYYNELEEGYFFQMHRGSSEEYLTHSFERLFGLMVGNENKRIKGV